MAVEVTIGNVGAWKLFEALFPEETAGHLEVRAIHRNAGVRQQFIRIGERGWGWHGTRRDARDSDVYFGVAPRTKESGTKDAITGVQAAWVDLDDPSSAAALAFFPLPPAYVVTSGTNGRHHAYWPLTEAATPVQIERLNRALAEQLGGDPAVAHASAVMRMPGTYNFKHDPPVKAELVHADDRRFTIAELEAVVAVETDTASTSSTAGPANDPVSRILERLDGVHQEGDGWRALCPAHDDHQPSLSIAEGGDGRCLIHCFAGCSIETVVSELGLQMKDLFPAGGDQKRSRSSDLVDLAEKTGIAVFRTPGGAGHAEVRVERHRETWPLESDGFADWLRSLHYHAHSEALRDAVLEDAIATFKARSRFESGEREVHRRVARVDDRILVDLGDRNWRAIEIDAEGWQVVDDPDVNFVRDPSTRPLPDPVAGASIEELRSFVNCADEGSWLRLCAFLVMCFNPSGPYPVCYVTGEQGSAKSTVSRLIHSLTDPREAPLLMGTPPVRELAVNANSVWVLGFDNVSKLPPAFSDALCQLATGGGYRTRRLYTDAEPFILDLKRPVTLNAIGQVIVRPDLLDRVAQIELSPIPPEQRRTEDEFRADWTPVRPRVLGALLDGVAAALAHADEVDLEGFPRMADFARWGEAAGEAFGWQPGALTASLDNSRQDLLEGSADAHPEIGALLALMDDCEEWVDSASELLKQLTDKVDDAVSGNREWPKRPDALSNRLIQHAPLLRTYGIEITRGREGGGKRKRFVRITKGRDTGTRGDA